MSFAYMPFYTGDYYRDTRHLSMLQHGAYRQLLDHCWDQRGPLPLDVTKCYRVCGAVSKEEQDAVRQVIEEFFVLMDDGHYNPRLQRELERCDAISGARSEAGRRGGLAKAKQLPSKRQASAKQVPLSPSPSPTPTPTPTPTPETAIAEPVVPVASRPTRATKKAPDSFVVDAGLQQWAREHVPGVDIDAETAKFMDYTFRTAHSDWAGAWRNWMRRVAESRPRVQSRGTPAWVAERDQREARAAEFAGRYAAARSQPAWPPESMGTVEVIDVDANRLG